MPATAKPRPLHRPLLGVFAAALLALAADARAAAPSLADAPIINFRLALFDDETGRKTSDLRGGSAVYRGTEQIEIREFTLTLLDRRNTLALRVTSPKALLQLQTRIAAGDDHIDVAGPGYTLAGKRWRCEEPVRRITIRDGAQVVFQAPLIDLLK